MDKRIGLTDESANAETTPAHFGQVERLVCEQCYQPKEENGKALYFKVCSEDCQCACHKDEMWFADTEAE